MMISLHLSKWKLNSAYEKDHSPFLYVSPWDSDLSPAWHSHQPPHNHLHPMHGKEKEEKEDEQNERDENAELWFKKENWTKTKGRLEIRNC